MQGFKCHKCGYSSLVRSNFKCIVDKVGYQRSYECRAVGFCSKYKITMRSRMNERGDWGKLKLDSRRNILI